MGGGNQRNAYCHGEEQQGQRRGECDSEVRGTHLPSATGADVAMPSRELAAELARLRRLMRTAGRAESESEATPS